MFEPHFTVHGYRYVEMTGFPGTPSARTLTGPAANPECVWLGERAVNLLSRDDLDTAFRHLELYDRFGCPGAHMQASFRCLVRLGIPDPKAARAHVETCIRCAEAGETLPHLVDVNRGY